MKKLACLLAALACSVLSSFPEEEFRPQLDPGGHRSLPRALSFTPDGKRVVSASDEGTIKIWDIDSSTCISTHYEASGSANIGLAVSPDSKYIYSAWISYGHLMYIKKIDLNSLHVLSYMEPALSPQGGDSFALKLKLSPDGNTLAYAVNHTLFLSDAGTLETVAELSCDDFHIQAFSFSPSGRSLVTGSEKGSLVLWDMEKGCVIKRLRSAHSAEIYEVLFSRDGRSVFSVSRDGSVKKWGGSDLRLQGTVYSVVVDNPLEDVLSCGDSDPSSDRIAFGGTLMMKDPSSADPKRNDRIRPVFLYDDSTGKTTLQALGGPYFAIAFSKAGSLMATSGSSGNEIVVFDPVRQELKAVLSSASLLDPFHGGRSIAFSADGKSIYFANRTSGGAERSRLSLADLKVSAAGIPSDAVPPRLNIERGIPREYRKLNDYGLDAVKIVELFPNLDLTKDLEPAYRARMEADGSEAMGAFQFVKSGYDGFGHVPELMNVIRVCDHSITGQSGAVINSWAFSPDQRYAYVAHGGLIIQADPETGSTLKTFSGHEDTVGSLAISPDSRWLASASYDMTIKLWDVSSGHLIASFFPHPDGRCIAWTADNYYMGDASLCADLRWVRQGPPETDSKFYAFDQFDIKFNRPDVVLSRIGIASKELVRMYEEAHARRLRKMGLEESSLELSFNAPEVKLTQDMPSIVDGGGVLSIPVSIVDAQCELDRVLVSVNNVPVFGRGGILLRPERTGVRKMTIDVPLIPGRNKIQISALNSKGVESRKETLYVHSMAEERKPVLYLVTVGVSSYADNLLNLEFPSKDARDLASMFLRSKRYASVKVRSWEDESAERAMLSGMGDFLADAAADDVAIMFFAGHGLRNAAGEYFFAAHDIDPQRLAETGISLADIERIMDGIKPFKKVLLLDTCFAGDLDQGPPASARIVQTDEGLVTSNALGRGLAVKGAPQLIRTEGSQFDGDMFADLRIGTGAVIIAASSGTEVSYEGVDYESKKISNGVFTYCLLAGMGNGAADRNGDGRVQVSELKDWVSASVSTMTKGLQNPSVRSENIEFDYPIF